MWWWWSGITQLCESSAGYWPPPDYLVTCLSTAREEIKETICTNICTSASTIASVMQWSFITLLNDL